MDGPPDFIYQTVPATYDGKLYTDFFFIRRIKYAQMMFDNGNATFEVTLVADSMDVEFTHRIVHAENLTVSFQSNLLFLLPDPCSPNGKSNLYHNASIDADFLKEVPFGVSRFAKKFRGHFSPQQLKINFNRCTSMTFLKNF
jgi:hypothetical protein